MGIVAVIATATFYIRLWGWEKLHAAWVPDYFSYTKGGFGVYPSPVGRILGSLGYLGMASCLASGLLIFCVASLATHRKTAALYAATTPIMLSTIWVGVDALGVLFLLLGIRGSRWFLVLAVLTHITLLPFVALVWLGRKGWDKRAVVATSIGGLFIILVAMLTPYSGVIYNLFNPLGFGEAIFVAMGFGFLSMVVVWRLLAHRYLVFAWWTICGLESAIEGHIVYRYGLPAAMFTAVNLSRANWKRITTTKDGRRIATQ